MLHVVMYIRSHSVSQRHRVGTCIVAFIVHAYYRNYAYFNEMLNKLVPAVGITVNSRHVFIIEKKLSVGKQI